MDEVDIGLAKITPGGLESNVIVAITVVDHFPEGQGAAITHTGYVLEELWRDGAADEDKCLATPLT
jgi:hypothetical protein